MGERRRLAALVLAVACLAGGCGSKKRAGSTVETRESLRSQSAKVCARLSLDELRSLTGDAWKEAKPAMGYVGCTWQVSESAPARIYAIVNDVAKDDPPLARQFFREETRPGYKAKPGIGDRAVYRADYGALVVLDDNVIYKVQVVTDKQHGPAVLATAREIYQRIRS